MVAWVLRKVRGKLGKSAFLRFFNIGDCNILRIFAFEKHIVRIIVIQLIINLKSLTIDSKCAFFLF